MKIIAITACPTGIAHIYMAADFLKKSALKFNVKIKVETQGAMGIENRLSEAEIDSADKIIIVSEIEIEQFNRFSGKKFFRVSLDKVLTDPDSVIKDCCNIK